MLGPCADGGINLSVSSPLTAYLAGSDVTVTVSAFGSFAPDTIVVDGGALGSFVGNFGPTSFDFTLPLSAFGEYELDAIAMDAFGAFATSGPISIRVDSTAVLESIEVSPEWIVVGYPGERYPLVVTGHYSGGFTRDLSPATSGTRYESSDPGLVMVNPNGWLRARAPGTAEITVRNGAFSAQSTAVVIRSPSHARRASPPR